MDSTTLGRLIDRHADALTLYARQWTDEPEDAVQDAFVSLAIEARTPDDPAAWLFKAVRHRAINAGIARRRRRRREDVAATAAPAWFEPESASRESGAIDADLAQAALEGLAIDHREVIVAHLWGGLAFAQIARLSGRSTSTTHRLYQAGLDALRERLGVPCRRTTP